MEIEEGMQGSINFLYMYLIIKTLLNILKMIFSRRLLLLLREPHSPIKNAVDFDNNGR